MILYLFELIVKPKALVTSKKLFLLFNHIDVDVASYSRSELYSICVATAGG